MNMGSRRDPNSPSFKTHHPSKGGRTRGNKNLRESNSPSSARTRDQTFASSPPQGQYRNGDSYPDSDELGEEDFDEEGYSEESERGAMEEDLPQRTARQASFTNDSLLSEDYSGYENHGSRLGGGTPRGVKRSRGGATISQGLQGGGKVRARRTDSAIPTIAKNMASQLGIAKLDDPDKLILRTETIISRLYNPNNNAEGQEQAQEKTIPTVVEGLSKLWQGIADHRNDGLHLQGDYVVGIGPDEKASGLQKARFLATLLLQLHHPPPVKGKQAFALSRLNKSSHFTKSQDYSSVPTNPTAFPKVLVDWLRDNHCPYTIATKNLLAHQPNPTAHINYWDLLLSLALRGQILAVIKILKLSDFRRARTAREDGQGQDGYHGTQLGNIERVITRAIQLLELCPALQDGDWNVTGSEWRIFRKRVEQASLDLANFAEGRDRDLDAHDPTFEASNFGIKSPPMTLSQSAREAESLVPWAIYQNLKAVYGILLGGATEIITYAQDWVEATTGLTIWWDGDDDDDDFSIGSSAMSRRSLKQSVSRGARLVDINNTAAYLRRLASAFEQATDESDETMFQINPINPVEVGLASVFEGDIEGVLALLRGWSVPIASAVIEIASLGGWYSSPAGSNMMAGFNESDLMVLSSYGQPDEGLTRDNLLVEYGEALFEKDILEDIEEEDSKEGWELSLAILIRLDDNIRANKIVGDLLNRISLLSDQRVDKILDICQEFGMEKEAEGIAEVRTFKMIGNVTKW